MLGMFSFVPYMMALCSVLLGLPAFSWKPTNARSKGTITKVLSSFILYFIISLAAVYLLVNGTLSFNPALLEYYFWFGIDIMIAAIFILNGYMATSFVTLPVFEQLPPPETAYMKAVQRPFGKGFTFPSLPAISRKRPIEPLEDMPTIKIAALDTSRNENS
jgi:hypothetical protein